MIQINIGDHTSPMAGYIAFPNNRREDIRWARRRAFWIARNKPGANPYFAGLPGGRTLQQLLDDNTIWINYHATLADWGQTNHAGGKEMAISVTAFRVSKWSVLATLIHELAHVNGVRGAVSPQAAEDALIPCGLGRQSERDTSVDDPATPFDPGIIGYRVRPTGSEWVYA
ncbi:hypothetical protein [Tropicimonas sp. IMCC6043]|uniref:hypothetical protein n=1 Tax=Tropicimonas sp. IMCC6043 TaxID=2510645 RepID=UPI00101C3D39|nr:hypothetical protein [Tropicimonas sp. IMCC6043]RYH11854.1 hypothetical protein EU800_04295 [Tropicimonas sp. IMCC6043]